LTPIQVIQTVYNPVPTSTVTLSTNLPATLAQARNGAGILVTQSVESSNIDIATEFTKLIVAQQAYSANTKMVTRPSCRPPIS